MKNIVSFSGGKDSTAMLLMMIAKGIPIDEIIFVDLGKEFPEMYEHIEKVRKLIGQKITTINISFDHWFAIHKKTKGKNKGQCGYGWPDFQNRWCTALKRDAIKAHLAHLSGQKYQDHRGIAYNEKHRINKNKNGTKIIYPLVEWKISEARALKYCYSQGFRWSGLYERFNRVSCWCCPLKRINEIKALYLFYPELWKQLKQMDKWSKRTFQPRKTLQEVEDGF